jgi:sulfopyruvate decarboxylase alpha subunit
VTASVDQANARAETDWPSEIFDVLKSHDIRHIVYVPDAGHATLIRRAQADARMTATVLTTEEEGIGYLLGAWLGGQRGALLMQSSGVGNCINILGLQQSCRFPLLMLITMRGDWAEFNPWQNPMGQATEAALKLMGILTWRADRAEDVGPAVLGAAEMAFNGDAGTAVLLGQRLIGRKAWVK